MKKSFLTLFTFLTMNCAEKVDNFDTLRVIEPIESARAKAAETLSDTSKRPIYTLVIGDSEAGACSMRVDEVKLPNERVSVDYKISTTIQYWSGGNFRRALESHPIVDNVVIFLGTNDYFSKSLPDIKPILDLMRERGLKCVWVGPTAVHDRRWPIDDLLREAVRPTCEYVDTMDHDIPLRDGVHPTWSGTLKWLRVIWAVKNG